MKRYQWIIISLSILLLAFWCLSSSTTAKELIVGTDPSTDFSSINEAVTAAESGDVIYINNGTYEINNSNKIIIEKPLTITGESTQNTIIKQIEYENLFEINADNVSIKNITVQGEFLSIIYINANHTTIEHVQFNPEGYADAISSGEMRKTHLFINNITVQQQTCVFRNFTHCIIKNTSFSSVVFQKTMNATITESVFTNAQVILDGTCQYNLIENCTFADYEYTSLFINGQYNLVYATLFQNIGPQGSAINLNGVNNRIEQCSFVENTIGITVFNTSNTVEYNNFINHSEAAVIAQTRWVGEDNSITIDQNWWANTTGPYHETVNPDGTGETVEGNVNCTTWLDASIPYQPLKDRPRYVSPEDPSDNQDDNPDDQDKDNASDGIPYGFLLPIIIGILAIFAILMKKR